MAVRTFYWNARIIGPARIARQRLLRRDTSQLFRRGNAGDIFNIDVIRSAYGEPAANVAEGGRRLLLIGSIAHNLQENDVLCGVGTKGTPIPSAEDVRCTVRAVRGPLTLEALAAAGHDVSDVKSLRDPGLMIRFHVDERPAERGRVGFLPHYRERGLFRGVLPKGVHFIDIDNSPTKVAREIQRVELLYTSSLHGVIFAHSLGRPCVLVRPMTEEPELKYRDYFASVDLPWRPWAPLAESLRAASPTSPVSLSFTREDFALPSADELKSAGIWD